MSWKYEWVEELPREVYAALLEELTTKADP